MLPILLHELINYLAFTLGHRGATDFFAGADGGDIRDPNDEQNPCPGSPIAEIHTQGFDDLKGCALAIAYNDNTCVWYRNTTFQVPESRVLLEDAPALDFGFTLLHERSTSDVALAEPQVPRRCGANPTDGKSDAVPGNCAYGAKQPFKQRTTQTFHPPFYLDLYNFLDGAQDVIFVDSYVGTIHTPGPNQTALPQLAQIPSGGSNSTTSTASVLPSGTGSSSHSSATSSASPGNTAPTGPALSQQCGLRSSSLSKRSDMSQ
ncbi:hypothetical protein FIBSPDRAFT_951761 [Athelia psychrophila]|uniref:Uncharacterized protein n=1 Tax=Athelia psychrophila TaxID=1759441 RepID=A0A166MD10_9AGAM|nr:hypothetical protein FIBSPDRAFT_951761 [Fibularhizoctonia sp. CBS 109695]